MSQTIPIAHYEISEENIRTQLKKAESRNKIRAFLLVAPLILFVLFIFIFPLGNMLMRSISSPTLTQYMPDVAKVMQDWDYEGIPDNNVFRVVAKALVRTRENKTVGRVANRLNSEQSGSRSLMTGTARALQKYEGDDFKTFMIDYNKKWAKMETWGAFKVLSTSYTLTHYLAAMDLEYGPDGKIVAKPEKQRIYVANLVKTLKISIIVTGLCLLLGYPQLITCLFYSQAKVIC